MKHVLILSIFIFLVLKGTSHLGKKVDESR